jgi:Uma2 family endonuclease
MPTLLTTPVIEARQRFVIPGISWNSYVQIVDALGEMRGLRTSFDGETLELMSTSQLHEWFKVLLGNLFATYALETDLSTKSAGGMTFRREDLERGLEPDNCYWLSHEHEMRHVWEADFRVHPAPDLCIEIEVSRTVVDRLAILAALGVPEVWRFDGRTLTVLQLVEGAYVESAASEEVPGFPVDDVLRFLDPAEDVGENTRLRRFVEFVRERAAGDA